MYQRSWIRLKHGLDSEGLSGSINSAKPFQPKSEQKEVWLSSPCSAVSAVTRPVIIHRFGGGGWEGNVLKWMLWSRWHSYVGGKKMLKLCWYAQLATRVWFMSFWLHSLNFIMVWVIMGLQSPSLQTLYLLYLSSLTLSLQPVRWVSISRWQAMACAVNVLSTATQRPELPSHAPATPTTIERRMTRRQLLAPVSTNRVHKIT